MHRLLVICGPTATGKTALALDLAKEYQGDIVSADSRQVYRTMDIGTGKDIPRNAPFVFVNSDMGGYYTEGQIRIWGYDLVAPADHFSVAQYMMHARAIINRVWEDGRLPILVGGTGLYIRAVIDGIETAHVPRNEQLRKTRASDSAADLHKTLSELDPVKARTLNESDSQNPRRLIRAIEVAQWKQNNQPPPSFTALFADVLMIGLEQSPDELVTGIRRRVVDRMNAGMLDEVHALLDSGATWDMQSMQSFGYAEAKALLSKAITLDEYIDLWVKHEYAYAKRQMTWFRKDDRIEWFATANTDAVAKRVESWYA